MTLKEYSQRRVITKLVRILREILKRWDEGYICARRTDCGRCDRLFAEANAALYNALDA